MIDLTSLADRLELFHGDAHDAAARVYARLPLDETTADALAGVRLAGHLIGPECRFAQTLPATIQFQDRGAGAAGLLAEAVVPDPCFWTPELPFLYRASIELISASGQKTALGERCFGIRRLGTRGRSLYLDGKRWVPRGVCREQLSIAELSAAREAEIVLRVRRPDEATCLEASRLGVPLLVDLHGSATEIAAEIRRLARWPAAFAAIVEPSLEFGQEFASAAKSLLLAADISTTATPPAWARAAFYNAADAETIARQTAGCELPIIAVRKLADGEMSFAAAREACDCLQSNLASIGDFAGYLV